MKAHPHESAERPRQSVLTEKAKHLQRKIIRPTAYLSAVYHLQKPEGKLMASRELYSGKLLFNSNTLGDGWDAGMAASTFCSWLWAAAQVLGSSGLVSNMDSKCSSSSCSKGISRCMSTWAWSWCKKLESPFPRDMWSSHQTKFMPSPKKLGSKDDKGADFSWW